jgi:hypothetical protein
MYYLQSQDKGAAAVKKHFETFKVKAKQFCNQKFYYRTNSKSFSKPLSKYLSKSF